MEDNQNNETIKENQKIYIGFGTRICLYSLLFLLLLSTGILLFLNSLKFKNETAINYTETSNLDYKVYLKENDFYDDKYLEENMIYVASLIDNVNVDFNYKFKSDENLNLEFTYKIFAELQITDEKSEKTFYKKTYPLSDEKNTSIKDKNIFLVKESLNIDYDYYNSLANKFKSSYGISTISKLKVYLEIEKNGTKEDEKIINDNNIMSIVIPLSEKAIDIKMDYNEINNKSKILHKSNVVVDNIAFVIISILLILSSIYALINLIMLFFSKKNNENKFEKYLKRMLLEYDRMIVETITFPDTTNVDVIKITKFSEILDVRDSLKLPIMYYRVNKLKAHFYITHENKIYLHTVKESDINKKNR